MLLFWGGCYRKFPNGLVLRQIKAVYVLCTNGSVMHYYCFETIVTHAAGQLFASENNCVTSVTIECGRMATAGTLSTTSMIGEFRVLQPARVRQGL